MKLRIQDNSLRLRLTQKEVALLGNQGSVESAIRFSDERTLSYSVSVSAGAEALSVRYEGNAINVLLPREMASAWAGNDETVLEGLDSGVQILVEKDFRCLHRPAASEPDAYPHPLA
jgi:hypothetical protein